MPADPIIGTEQPQRSNVLLGSTLLDQLLSTAAASDYPAGRAQLRTLLANSERKRANVILATTTLALALTLTVAAIGHARSDAATSRTRSDLAARVESARRAIADSENRISALGTSNRAMAARILNQSTKGVELQTAISATAPLAAATALSGQAGCSVIARKGQALTDRDVHAFVNQAWRSRPQAVAINGIRLSSTTAIRSAGSQLLVGFQPVSRPLKICALYGPPAQASIQQSFRQLDRLGSATGATLRHSISVMTLPPAFERTSKIRIARSQ